MKRILLLIVTALTLALSACGQSVPEPELELTQQAYTWCHVFDFTQGLPSGATLVVGVQNGNGLQSVNGVIAVTYTHYQTVAPALVYLTPSVTLGVGDPETTINYDLNYFGITDNGNVTFQGDGSVQILREYDYPTQQGTVASLTAGGDDTTTTITIPFVEIRGFGVNPFGSVNTCLARGTDTPTPTPTPVVLNTNTPTPLPTPTLTTCTYYIQYDFSGNSTEGFTIIDGGTGSSGLIGSDVGSGRKEIEISGSVNPNVVSVQADLTITGFGTYNVKNANISGTNRAFIGTVTDGAITLTADYTAVTNDGTVNSILFRIESTSTILTRLRFYYTGASELCTTPTPAPTTTETATPSPTNTPTITATPTETCTLVEYRETVDFTVESGGWVSDSNSWTNSRDSSGWIPVGASGNHPIYVAYQWSEEVTLKDITFTYNATGNSNNLTYYAIDVNFDLPGYTSTRIADPQHLAQSGLLTSSYTGSIVAKKVGLYANPQSDLNWRLLSVDITYDDCFENNITPTVTGTVFTTTPTQTPTMFATTTAINTPTIIATITGDDDGDTNTFDFTGTCTTTGNEPGTEGDGGWFEWLFGGIRNLVNCTIVPLMQFGNSLIQLVLNGIDNLVGTFRQIGDILIAEIRNLTDGVLGYLGAFTGFAQDVFYYVNGFVRNLFSIVLWFIENQLLGIWEFVQTAYQFIVDFIDVLIAIARAIIDTILLFLRLVFDLFNLWNNSTPIKPDGLPDCVEAPQDYSLCAVWYLLDNTLFAGTIGQAIPVALYVLVHLLLIINAFQFSMKLYSWIQELFW